MQILQLYLGSDISFDGQVALNKSLQPSNMDYYSESELDHDSEVEILVDNNSEVINLGLLNTYCTICAMLKD